MFWLTLVLPALTRRYALLLPLAIAPVQDSRKQVDAAFVILKDLAEDDGRYATVIAGGGDSLRRELGFVGSASPLVAIDKALTSLMPEDEGDYNEEFERFILALRAADADAYSANFVEFSAAKATPQQYFNSARRELRIAKKALAEMIHLLGDS